MYVSVMTNPKGDDYMAHQALMERFAGNRILFQRHKFSAYVLSEQPPEAGAILSVDVSKVISDVKPGLKMPFSIRINPAVAKKSSDRTGRGVRKAVPARDVKRWLDSKFIKNGFMAKYSYEVEDFRESVKKGGLITMASVLVRGTLEVLNEDTVRGAMVKGIGRGKGLGFGMLYVYNSVLS